MRRNKRVLKKDDEIDPKTTVKLFILFVFLSIVVLTPELTRLWPGFVAKINQKLWLHESEDNVEFKGALRQGENHDFIAGNISSGCASLNKDDHCPLKVKDADFILILGKNSFFDMDQTVMDAMKAHTDVEIKAKDISVLGILEKGDKDVEFTLEEWIPNAKICTARYIEDSSCPIIWEKTFELSATPSYKTRSPILAHSATVLSNGSHFILQLNATAEASELWLAEYSKARGIAEVRKIGNSVSSAESGETHFTGFLSVPLSSVTMTQKDIYGEELSKSERGGKAFRALAVFSGEDTYAVVDYTFDGTLTYKIYS